MAIFTRKAMRPQVGSIVAFIDRPEIKTPVWHDIRKTTESLVRRLDGATMNEGNQEP